MLFKITNFFWGKMINTPIITIYKGVISEEMKMRTKIKSLSLIFRKNQCKMWKLSLIFINLYKDINQNKMVSRVLDKAEPDILKILPKEVMCRDQWVSMKNHKNLVN